METTPILDGIVRRLWPTDLPGFRAHLLRLDSDSRHSRFGGAVSDEFLMNYAERCFGIDDLIYGYLVDGETRGAGELRGIGHQLPLGFGGSAEAAFSVEANWRRRGVGEELMRRIVRAARNRRAGKLYMSCLASNHAMMRLARKFTDDLRREPDEAFASIEPRGPTPISMFEEASQDAAGFATAMLDLQKRTFPGKSPAR